MQLKEQDLKNAKEINLRRIINNIQHYVKNYIKYNSQLSGNHAFDNSVCKLDVNYEGNLKNLALVNRQ